ncbi:MAG: hypothetical protein IT522_12505 [Burkholderiales bacterium]|nr:hypothetical protein [Burkholderiales bacterium]
MNGLTLVALLAAVVGIALVWRAGVASGRRAERAASGPGLRPAVVAPPPNPSVPTVPLATLNARLAASLVDADAARGHLAQLAEERRGLFAALATARTETARYRALVVDLENQAPPPLLGGPDAPDDLRLIVGVGPVLARMLQQMGITTYRQIARWSERDIDEFEARLPEFPGRIRRDAWVTQARALHQSKYGEALPVRDR